MKHFDFDINNIIKIIKDKNRKAVGLQFPEGLKRQAVDIAMEIEEKAQVSAVISGNPCFGACDIDMLMADKVDVLFHFGHAAIEDYNNVVFIEMHSCIDLIPAVRTALPLLKTDRIGIITTVQHVHKLEEVVRVLKEHGKEGIIEKGDLRTRHPGQVLGCNFTSARVDCEEILYLGSGLFHPIGAAIATKKRVIAADPFLNQAFEVLPEKFLRKRWGYIAGSMDAEVFGIIVSTKCGQNRTGLAKKLKETANKHGKKAFIVLMDIVTPEQMHAFKADAYVNTACPRIAIDDAERFHAPVLTPQEFEIVLGEREVLEMDEILYHIG